MKKILGLFVLITLLYFSSSGQSLDFMMSSGNSFDDIRSEINSRYQGRSYIKSDLNYLRDYKQFKRWEYYWKHRLDENGNFAQPQNIYDAWREAREIEKTTNSNWEYFGPKTLPISNVSYYPGLGRINAIAVHPTNHNVLIAGGASSGIWKSTNRGQTWIAKTDNLPNVGISCIVFDPNNYNVIYAATGDSDGGRGPFSTGLFKSTDQGETWSIVGLPKNYSQSFSIRRIVMPSTPANTLLVTTSLGTQKSNDGGLTFQVVNNISSYDIVKSANSNNIFYVGTANGDILKTIDGGNNWSNISPSTPNLRYRVELGVTAANPNIIVALDLDGRLVKSTNAGASWSSLSSITSYESQGGYNMTVAISPTNADRIIVGGVHGWRTLDGGSTWQKYLNGYWQAGNDFFYVHSDHHEMIFIPNSGDTLLVAHDGGVHIGDLSQNNQFADITNGLFTTQYYGLGVLRTNADVLIAGCQDNDAVYINNNNSLGIIAGSDGYDGLIDFSNPDISYVCITGGRCFKTTDNWQSSSFMSIPGLNGTWDVPMAMHPTDPSIFYFAGKSLVKTTDSGNTWSTLYVGNAISEFVKDIEIAPSNGEILVMATYSDIRRSTDGGSSWSSIRGNLPISNNISITGVAISSTNPNHIYISMSGFASGNKVFKTNNAGQSWDNISFNIPNIPVNDIVYAAGTNNDVYIATDLGVLLNSQSTNSWQMFNTNLPYTQVFELDFNYGSNTIYAATYGRGIWKSPLENNVTYNSEQMVNNGIDIYPTISQGTFNIDFLDNALVKDITIYNVVGGVVYHSENVQKLQIINIADERRGLYFVNVNTVSGRFSQKIILQP